MKLRPLFLGLACGASFLVAPFACGFLFPSLHEIASAWAQSSTPNPQQLNDVLDQLDRAAANFRNVQADFVWDQYQKVVNETDTQKGTIYFRRAGRHVDMAADINEPDKKYVLFTDSKIQLYQPKIDQVTEYNTGKNQAEFESFLVLGFGGGGHEMLKSFDATFAGHAKIGDTDTEVLDLVPKSVKVRNTFAHITLWIDPSLGISIQQKFFEPGDGDYRLAKYSDIRLNQKIPDDKFKLKTTAKTKIVSQG